MQFKDSISKVKFIILVLLLSVGALGYWGVRSYLSSSQAIERVLKPDSESDLINALYKNVIQSDIHLNNFFLTGDSIQWKQAKQYDVATDSLMNWFLLHRPEPWPQIDTLASIIIERKRINSILYNLKSRQGSQFFTEQALNRIKTQLSDSVYVEKSMTIRQDWIARRDTIERMNIVRTPERGKGISRLWWWLTGIEKVKLDTLLYQEPTLDYDREVSVDSSIIRDYSIDSTLAAVQAILTGVLEEEIVLQRNLRKVELELISYNELLVTNIRALLDEIAGSNFAQIVEEKFSSQKSIEKAHLQAFLMAGIGVFIAFILLLVLIKDLTQTNKYRQELEEERDRAKELAKAKEVFLSKMSHEIRTPLHSISGFAALLEQETLTKQQRAYLNGITNADNYLSQLLNNILEQSRINAGTFRLENARLHVPHICEELDLLFKPQQIEKNTSFSYHFSENLAPIDLVVDALKIKQVLINLLGNAFKFTQNGEISLHFNLQKSTPISQLSIHVSDTGIGIDEAYKDYIFKPFGRIEQSNIAQLPGTGLGLSISKHIIEHLGGSIALMATESKGSVFHIQMPVECAVHEALVKKEQPAIFAQKYSLNVVLVEDDAWNAKLLMALLKPMIEEIRHFETAQSALAHIQAKKCDLVFTDLNLPGEGGEWLLNEIQKSTQLPVVAVSASINPISRTKHLEAGFVAVLGKPFTKEDLSILLAQLFSTPISHTRNFESSKPNWASINQFGGSEEEQLRYRTTFTASFAEKCAALSTALEQNELNEVQRMAHQLKSACEQVGIIHLSEALQTLELRAQLRQKDAVQSEAQQLLIMLERIKTELSKSAD